MRETWQECPTDAAALENMLMFFDEVRDRLVAMGILTGVQIDEQQRLLRSLAPHVPLPAAWGIFRVACEA